MTEPSAGQQMVRGSAWMVAMRWTMRSIGLVSTVILARLLAPGDFGIIAMAMLVISFLEILAQCGVDLNLIRQTNPDRRAYDSAWTLQILLSVAVASIIFAAAHPAAGLFDEPRLVPVIKALSLKTVLMGFENIGVVNFRKDLNFRMDFSYQVLKKLSGFVVVVGAAALLRSYWALVIGILAGQTIQLALSYVLSPYRPRWNTSGITAMLAFSSWMTVFRFGRFLQRKVDQLIVGGVAGTGFMGSYHVASELATAPTNELVVPMSRGLYPVYARLQGDLAYFARSYCGVVATVAFLCMPIGAGLALVADDLVAVVLGQKWLGLSDMLPYLALYGAVFALMNTVEAVFIVLNRVRLMALLALTNTAVLGLTLFGVTQIASVALVAPARLVLVLVMFPFFFAALRLVLPVRLGALATALWPSVTAAAMMSAAVLALHDVWGSAPAGRLAGDIATGVVTYALASVAIWRLRGRPEGVEATLVARVRQGGRRLTGPVRGV